MTTMPTTTDNREDATLRLAAQHAVTRILAESQTLAEAAPQILEAIGGTLDWQLGMIWEVDPREGAIVCVESWHASGVDVSRFEPVTRTTRLELGAGLPGRVWAAGEAAWVADVANDPTLPRATAATAAGLRGSFAFPIENQGAILGVIEFFTREARDPDDILLDTMAALGSQIGNYIVRQRAEEALRESEARKSAMLDEVAQALANEQQARVRAERAERRAAFLAEAGALLETSLDYEATLANIARLAVPHIADWCAIDLVVGDGTVRRVAGAHVDPGKADLVAELQRSYPRDPKSPQGLGRVLRTGLPEVRTEVTEDFLEGAAENAEHLRLLMELRPCSYMVVPLLARGRILGAMTFSASESDRRYGEDDLTLAEELCRRCALAVDNSRLYSERSYIARTLQESLLPPHLPDIPGIEVAARYHAAAEGIDVGGDFYDLFHTGGTTWALALGDVCGKGADAAAVTALVRYTLRAGAMQESKPSRALALLNEAILRQRSDQRFCTAVFGTLDTGPESPRLTASSGGHPLPLLLRAGGQVEPVGTPGTLLGVVPDPDLSDHTVELGPGDAVVFFTDGVIEASAQAAGVFGEEELAGLLAESTQLDAPGLAERIEDAALAVQADGPRDDIAILVVRVRP